MSQLRTELLIAGGLVAFGMLLGGILSYYLHEDAPAPEVVAPAAEVIQEDGSKIIARTPASAPEPAPHLIPKDWKEVRRVSATIQPTKQICEAIKVDLSLVKDDAGGQRVIVSSPDGEVTQAIDIPILPSLAAAPVRKWAAGTSWDPFNNRYGTWLERDIGRFRFGADVRESNRGSAEALVRVGFTF